MRVHVHVHVCVYVCCTYSDTHVHVILYETVSVVMHGSRSRSSTHVQQCPSTHILTGGDGLMSLPLIRLVRRWQVSSSLQTSQSRFGVEDNSAEFSRREGGRVLGFSGRMYEV